MRSSVRPRGLRQGHQGLLRPLRGGQVFLRLPSGLFSGPGADFSERVPRQLRRRRVGRVQRPQQLRRAREIASPAQFRASSEAPECCQRQQQRRSKFEIIDFFKKSFF